VSAVKAPKCRQLAALGQKQFDGCEVVGPWPASSCDMTAFLHAAMRAKLHGLPAHPRQVFSPLPYAL